MAGNQIRKIEKVQGPDAIQGQWTPDPPDFGIDMIRLLAWLKKHGSRWPLRSCQIKWNQLGHEDADLERVIHKMKRNDLVTVGQVGDSEKLVQVINRKWADDWASYQGVELPHHGIEGRAVEGGQQSY